MRRLLCMVLLPAALAGCAPDAASELALGKQSLAGGPAASADARVAEGHLRRAAEQGLPAAAYHLGLLYRRGGAGVPVDRKKALHWLREAAEHDLPDAQFALGQMLLAGEAAAPDPVQARRWFERAAEHEHPEANLELAMAYRRGDLGVAPDAAMADRYLMEAEHGLKHRPTPP